MTLRLTIKTIKALLKQHPRENLRQDVQYWSDDRTKEYEIETFKHVELETLRALCLSMPDEPGASTAAKKIATYFVILQSPDGKVIRKLEEWVPALREYLKKGHKHWVFTDRDSEFLLPFFICDIQYRAAEKSRDNYIPASVSMTGLAMKRGTRITQRWHWHHQDVVGKTVPDVLDEDRIFFPMEELVKDYDTTLAKYLEMQPRTGQQFTGEGACRRTTEDRWGYSTSEEGYLVKDSVKAKLVMDDKHEEGGEFGNESGISSNKYWETGEEVEDDDEGEGENDTVAIPVHPFVKMFNLDEHEFIIAHSDQLTLYKWTPELGDKLILPPGSKEIITVLMDTANETLEDIVKGKSGGGTIVICTSPPGCGKTLTAEVTSEVIQRPLYKVQCSQLGTDESEIEKELKITLARAERWQALLLIDEADVYVRTREKDIQQNAIVGVFLRVLEYYRGVLFLTTNMPGAIDDAIMSRATAHLKYELPTKAELEEIWMVLAAQFGLKVTKKEAKAWAWAFNKMTGRDVKSLLKLAIRYSRNKKCEVNLDVLKKLAPHKDVTVAITDED